MKSFLLAMCLMFPIATYAINDVTQGVSDTISVDKLAKRDGRWTRVNYLMIVPTQGTGLDKFWCWIMKNGAELETDQSYTDSIITLKSYVDSQLKAYDLIESYDPQKYLELKSNGEEIDLNECWILPTGKPLGNIQVYSVKYVNDRNNLFELSIVYDKSKDRVLTVDDIFVSEIAMKIKKDFGGYFINVFVNDYKVFCGNISNGSLFPYNGHSYDYIGHESDLTDDFKQSVGFCEIAENLIKERERVAKEKEIEQENAKEKELEEENKVYEFVHVMPKLDLRKKEMKEFFDKNFHWPDELKKENYKGRFSVSYIVEKDGSISDVHMRDSTFANSPIEKEMERVIKLMPACVPGRFKNKIVRTRMLYYLSFNQKSQNGITYKGHFYNEIAREEEESAGEILFKTAATITAFFLGHRYNK